MASVILNGDTSGSVTISPPAVAGTQTVTLPAASGVLQVSGNMPAFSARISTGQANQTPTSNVFTKVTFDSEEFDTNNNFASSTFTPTVAGYYQLSASLDMSVTGTLMLICLYKNGSLFKYLGGPWNITSTGNEFQVNGSAIVSANGSTDYFEIFVKLLGVSPNVYSGNPNSYFQGCLIRTA